MSGTIDYEGLAQTEYVGPVGFEKKAHQTHFGVSKKKELKGESYGKWVKIATGRYKLVY